MNLNKVFLLGRVTADPQMRKTPAGKSVTSMGIATNRTWTDKDGAKQEAVEFHNVVLWAKQAEIAASFLAKGSLVLIEGRLETRSWTDKDGNERRATEIIAESLQLGPKPGMKESTAKVAVHSGDDEPTISLDDEIKPEDIPF